MKSQILRTLMCGVLLTACCGILAADEMYSGGVTVDIDRDVYGFLWIDDATVNLYENAHIMDDLFFGDVFTSSGSVLNIYGGQIDGVLFISTAANGMPESQVTIYGSDFAVDGVPVDPSTTELFLQQQELTGVYASGTPFAHIVDCAVTGDFYLTIKLGWIASEADIEVSTPSVDFGQVDIGLSGSAVVTVTNTGNANLTLQALNILQPDPAEFDFVPLQQLPMTIEPETSVDIELYYTPVLEGLTEAVLQIVSDDPDESVVEVALYGEGIPVILTPSEQMDLILDAFEVGIADGSIEGRGRGRSADCKARVFYKTLNLAAGLIDAGYERHALTVLVLAERKCDGQSRPADFIQGEGVPLLNVMINDLIDTLNESVEWRPLFHKRHRWHW